MSALELKIPPPIVCVLIAFLMWLCTRYMPVLDFFLPWHKAIAVMFAIVGLIFDLSGLIRFIRARTTVNPFKPDTTKVFITKGVYQWSRNPMYLGLLLILFGWAIYLSNTLAIVLLPVFILYINRFQIQPEEIILAAKFGDAFAVYKQSVRKWL